MKRVRWLLPFTSGMDMGAIDALTHLAANGGATLVAVSLIIVPPDRRSRGARLEHIQQSNDFLEAITWIAAKYHVPVERHEVITSDALQQIQQLIDDLQCDNIVLVSRVGKEALLRVQELKSLLVDPPAPLVLIRLATPTKPTFFRRLLVRLRGWLPPGRVSPLDGENLWSYGLVVDESVRISKEEGR